MDFNEKKKYLIITILVFFLGMAVGNVFFDNTFSFHLSDEGEKKIRKIDKILEKKFLWKKEFSDDEMISSYVNTFNDPYTSYLNKEDFQSRMEMTDGSFVGVGIVFSQKEDGSNIIERVIKGGPADKAGVPANSIILKIDNNDVRDTNYIVTHLKGKADTEVSLTVLTEDGDEKTFDLVRKKIVVESVESKMINKDIGYVKISEFNGRTGKLFKENIKKLDSAKGYIIDLRDNGGGVLTDCIEIADFLLGEQKIMIIKDNELNVDEEFSDAKKLDKPYVVLVNSLSASASEVLAGAIQDSGDSKLIGVKTYGKGIIQEILPLGDNTGLSVTVYEYFSPKGRKIHKKGLTPDIIIENTEDKDLQLEKAVEVLKESFI